MLKIWLLGKNMPRGAIREELEAQVKIFKIHKTPRKIGRRVHFGPHHWRAPVKGGAP